MQNNLPSTGNLRVRSEAGHKATVPCPPKIVLDWADDENTYY